jgi:hypothetical protein
MNDATMIAWLIAPVRVSLANALWLLFFAGTTVSLVSVQQPMTDN